MTATTHSRALRTPGLFLALVLATGQLSSSARAEPAAAGGEASASRASEPGFVVWESNRSGEFRIWRQGLGGGKAKQLSPEEPGRDHCCAKLSPNGSRLVYLSLPGGAGRYSRDVGVLHLADADGGRDRALAPDARHYGEHRAAVWWGEDELVYIDGRNATTQLVLSTGKRSELVPPSSGEGWLLAPGGRIGSGNTPTFSDASPGQAVRLRPSLGGCQPTFSNDGRLAVWSAGAGGPIDAFDLATRRTWTVIEKGDPHLPAGRGYVYFPALSNDNSLLAVGASPGEHDHFRADYDIFVLDLDPETLLPTGAGRPISPNPAVDRFPDLYRSPLPGRSGRRPVGSTTAATAATAPAARGEIAGRGLVFLWQRADAENRLSAKGASEVLEPQGLAWIDRHRGLALGGGSFAAKPESGQRLAEGLMAKHQMSLSLLVTPASLQERGPIVAFSDGPRAGNFTLRQAGDRILLDLRTSDSPKEGISAEVARLRSTSPTHLLVTFSPGRLESFLDGARQGASAAPTPLAGDFFPWRPRALAFGGAAKQPERWRGTLAEIAIWNRPLAGAEIAAEAARLRQLLQASPSAARIAVEVRLRGSSPAPTLQEISPYREALVVDEVEVVRQLSGPPIAASRLRVARWGILDGQTLVPPQAGGTYRLVLEPFASQPQLTPHYLADKLPPGSDLTKYFDLGASAAP